jgi:choline kinase
LGDLALKAIILSAGQGRRLLPLTAETPKCILKVAGQPILRWQVDTLLAAGVDDIVVVSGYGADKVEAEVERYDHRVRTLYNPFHLNSDNLASCWLARYEMMGDFLLLNGDTLFEEKILRSLLTARNEVNVTVDRKGEYDDDDMKVQAEGDRLRHIGKTLTAEQSDAESIGLLMFRGQGGSAFTAALDRSMRAAKGLRQWYLSVIDEIAQEREVHIHSIEGMSWAEVDTPEDLENASRIMEAASSRVARAD